MYLGVWHRDDIVNAIKSGFECIKGNYENGVASQTQAREAVQMDNACKQTKIKRGT